MNQLQNGCSYSDVWASPKDWEKTTSQKSLSKTWYVQCYYFDPRFAKKYPKGFPFRKKLNKIDGLAARKEAVKLLLQEIPKLFTEKGFNPITKRYTLATNKGVLSPDIGSAKAIELAWDKIEGAAIKGLKKNDNYIEGVSKPFSDVKVAKNRFVKGLLKLKYDEVPIKDLKKAYIKETIDCLDITDGYHKKFISYMSKIWNELEEYGCVDGNPFKTFKTKKPQESIREVVNDADFYGIMNYLNKNCYTFFRYAMMFHMSGGRTSELFLLQKKNVDLSKQEYRVWVKKGDRYTEEIKVIMYDALPYWEEIISECSSEDQYLFSKGLMPGTTPITSRQISIRWNRHIKTNYSNIIERKINADFYTLKHLFLDRLDEAQFNQFRTIQEALNTHESGFIIPANVSQIHASHKTAVITDSVYLTKKKERERASLKSIRIPLIKTAS